MLLLLACLLVGGDLLLVLDARRSARVHLLEVALLLGRERLVGRLTLLRDQQVLELRLYGFVLWLFLSLWLLLGIVTVVCLLGALPLELFLDLTLLGLDPGGDLLLLRQLLPLKGQLLVKLCFGGRLLLCLLGLFLCLFCRVELAADFRQTRLDLIGLGQFCLAVLSFLRAGGLINRPGSLNDFLLFWLLGLRRFGLLRWLGLLDCLA